MSADGSGPSRFRWDLGGITVAGETGSDAVADRWAPSFAPRQIELDGNGAELCARLEVAANVPQAPTDLDPRFTQDDLLEYYVSGPRVVVRFPRFGRLDMDLDAGTTEGVIVEAALTTYGVFEDVVAVALSPHLRRRGRYLVHAFAAALDGQGVLIVGGMGAGKTTTGLSLVAAGWNLLSNDSPLLTTEGQVAAYPGLIAAFPDTLDRFDATASLADNGGASATITHTSGRPKVCFPAESVWPDTWRDGADLAAICFPVIEDRSDHLLEPLNPGATLTRLLPHSIERWDTDTIPAHLSALRRACERSTGYVLRLGPDPTSVPDLLESVLSGSAR